MNPPPKLLRRAEVARRLACSLRTVDKLASSGALRRVILPGRKRSAGFLEFDVNELIISGQCEVEGNWYKLNIDHPLVKQMLGFKLSH